VASYILAGLIARPTFSQFGVCRLSCHRPFTPASARILVQTVLNVVHALVGSVGWGFPNGNYEPFGVQLSEFGFVPLGMAINASSATLFRGIVRPVPPSVFVSPTTK